MTNNQDDRTVEDRDLAENAADELASLILGEPIDWADHHNAWMRAVEQVKYMKESGSGLCHDD